MIMMTKNRELTIMILLINIGQLSLEKQRAVFDANLQSLQQENRKMLEELTSKKGTLTTTEASQRKLAAETARTNDEMRKLKLTHDLEKDKLVSQNRDNLEIALNELSRLGDVGDVEQGYQLVHSIRKIVKAAKGLPGDFNALYDKNASYLENQVKMRASDYFKGMGITKAENLVELLAFKMSGEMSNRQELVEARRSVLQNAFSTLENRKHMDYLDKLISNSGVNSLETMSSMMKEPMIRHVLEASNPVSRDMAITHAKYEMSRKIMRSLNDIRYASLSVVLANHFNSMASKETMTKFESFIDSVNKMEMKGELFEAIEIANGAVNTMTLKQLVDEFESPTPTLKQIHEYHVPNLKRYFHNRTAQQLINERSQSLAESQELTNQILKVWHGKQRKHQEEYNAIVTRHAEAVQLKEYIKSKALVTEQELLNERANIKAEREDARLEKEENAEERRKLIQDSQTAKENFYKDQEQLNKNYEELKLEEAKARVEINKLSKELEHHTNVLNERAHLIQEMEVKSQQDLVLLNNERATIEMVKNDMLQGIHHLYNAIRLHNNMSNEGIETTLQKVAQNPINEMLKLIFTLIGQKTEIDAAFTDQESVVRANNLSKLVIKLLGVTREHLINDYARNKPEADQFQYQEFITHELVEYAYQAVKLKDDDEDPEYRDEIYDQLVENHGISETQSFDETVKKIPMAIATVIKDYMTDIELDLYNNWHGSVVNAQFLKALEIGRYLMHTMDDLTYQSANATITLKNDSTENITKMILGNPAFRQALFSFFSIIKEVFVLEKQYITEKIGNSDQVPELRFRKRLAQEFAHGNYNVHDLGFLNKIIELAVHEPDISRNRRISLDPETSNNANENMMSFLNLASREEINKRLDRPSREKYTPILTSNNMLTFLQSLEVFFETAHPSNIEAGYNHLLNMVKEAEEITDPRSVVRMQKVLADTVKAVVVANEEDRLILQNKKAAELRALENQLRLNEKISEHYVNDETTKAYSDVISNQRKLVLFLKQTAGRTEVRFKDNRDLRTRLLEAMARDARKYKEKEKQFSMSGKHHHNKELVPMDFKKYSPTKNK